MLIIIKFFNKHEEKYSRIVIITNKLDYVKYIEYSVKEEKDNEIEKVEL